MIKIFENKQQNIFSDSTDTADYDKMRSNKKLKGDATSKDYYKFEKGIDWVIDYMTAKEYMDLCSDKVFGGSNAYDGVFDKTVDKYAENMANGDKFPLPYIDLHYKSQEGRHRMLAAAKAFGENTEFPVLIVFDANPTDEEIAEYAHKAYNGDEEWAIDYVNGRLGRR